MRIELRMLLLSSALAAAPSACSDSSGSHDVLDDPDAQVAIDSISNWPESTMTVDEEAPKPTFEPFDIELNQSVTVGAFRLDIRAAKVAPQTEAYRGDAVVQLDFVAENLSTETHEPLDPVFEHMYISSDRLLLEIAGEFFYGLATTESIPGLRTGQGFVKWEVPFEEGVTLDGIRSAILTIGGADQNQAVVPFADPASATTLADIDLGLAFKIDDFRDADLEVSSVNVQYSSHSKNELFEAGTARLFMDALLSDVQNKNSERWVRANAFLERPDGVRVAPIDLNENIGPNDRTEVRLAFELVRPVQGTYVFGAVDRELGTRTVSMEIP